MPSTPLNILHLTPQLSRAGGGAATYLWDLVKFTAPLGVASHVAGLGDRFTQRDIAGNLAASVFAARPTLAPTQGFSLQLHRYLNSALPKVDLIHAHGLRNGIGFEALRFARRTGLPLLVSPHGMLYPDLLNRSPVRKWVVETLWDRNYRRRANCFHATSSDEAQVIRQHHPDKPVAVVPIGLDQTQFDVSASRWVEEHIPAARGKHRLLFLGIMDRKKGLLRLAQAWGDLCRDFPDWHLVIAGHDLGGHEAEVRAAIDRAGARDNTSFVGGVYGSDKARLMVESDLFVLPTDWENFGIVIAEALASGLPVITTQGAPWELIESHGCGWWIDRSVNSLVNTLEHAMKLTPGQRREMGKKGKRLVQDRFSWDTIAPRMRLLYECMIAGREFPQIDTPEPRHAA